MWLLRHFLPTQWVPLQVFLIPSQLLFPRPIHTQWLVNKESKKKKYTELSVNMLFRCEFLLIKMELDSEAEFERVNNGKMGGQALLIVARNSCF